MMTLTDKAFQRDVGGLYDYNFRTIIKIYRLLEDDKILENDKVFIAAKLFGPDVHPVKAYKDLFDFLQSDSEIRAVTRVYDYDFDAEEIYCDFIRFYQIDLLEAEFLHWTKFNLLLRNLPDESSFKQKIELRTMDTSGYKGEALSKLNRAKRAVLLPVKMTEDELKKALIWDKYLKR
jgi:hypothetical protein